MSIVRPPADLSCADLFATWLPETFARARAAGARAPDVVVAVVLDGDGGGEWTLRVAGGQLTVADGSDASAVITLRQSVADFRAAVWGEGEVGALVPPQLDLTAAITGETKLPLGALGQVKGTLNVEIPGFAGRTWKAAVAFGGAAAPSATVTVDVPTLEELRSGALQPAQAFFAGKIAVTGDVPWLMQVGMSVAAGGLM
ncbi:MAG: SCP2 sterol-binding domain-containing protein [Deltaproteobacteria bacterium]|nr:SCP2 sterol-binding domain-containing protein [Kofleriaceae bacterium]